MGANIYKGFENNKVFWKVIFYSRQPGELIPIFMKWKVMKLTKTLLYQPANSKVYTVFKIAFQTT
jgi:hypothetical protein